MQNNQLVLDGDVIICKGRVIVSGNYLTTTLSARITSPVTLKAPQKTNSELIPSRTLHHLCLFGLYFSDFVIFILNDALKSYSDLGFC